MEYGKGLAESQEGSSGCPEEKAYLIPDMYWESWASDRKAGADLCAPRRLNSLNLLRVRGRQCAQIHPDQEWLVEGIGREMELLRKTDTMTWSVLVWYWEALKLDEYLNHEQRAKKLGTSIRNYWYKVRAGRPYIENKVLDGQTRTDRDKMS